MTTQYDSIGQAYKTFKELPVVDVELPSLAKPLGDITGLKCLDLACGLGRCSHFLRRQGAGSVLGLDLSPTMIEGARNSIAALPDAEKARFMFEVKDCGKPFVAAEGPFDIVLASYFLNYATSFDEMVAMWRNVKINLKPGGRFIALTPNTFCPMFEPYDDRYGVAIWGVEEVHGGWKARLKASVEPPVEFEMYHYMHDFYEKAAAEAGMTDLKWHPQVIPDDERKNTDFWDVLLMRPHINVLTARRATD